jgi:hypothetical protein
MSSEIPEVRQVLRALAAKVNEMPLAPSLGIRHSEESDTAHEDEDRHISEKNKDDEEHSRFKSTAVEYMMSGQNIGNALWGLRNTTSEHEEVREALAALSVKISQSTAELNGQNIGNALYSLHSMDGEASEVRAVLGSLAHKIVLSKQPLSGLDIGMSLFGLRSMNAEIPEVRIDYKIVQVLRCHADHVWCSERIRVYESYRIVKSLTSILSHEGKTFNLLPMHHYHYHLLTTNLTETLTAPAAFLLFRQYSSTPYSCFLILPLIPSLTQGSSHSCRSDCQDSQLRLPAEAQRSLHVHHWYVRKHCGLLTPPLSPFYHSRQFFTFSIKTDL